jgi:2'-5' RNA ligase
MKVFYVLHIKEKVLADCIDAIRFICNPAEKQRAHLTVRGPYQKRIDIAAISRKIVGDTVSIDSVGNFFDSGQNTVFFHCSAADLRSVWNKPHYPFNPHITLYDSGSSEFARRLFAVMSRYTYRMKFRADELEAIEARKGQDSLSLALAFNSQLASRLAGEKVTTGAIQGFSDEQRLRLVERICQHLTTTFTGATEAQNQPFQHRLPL